jgi:hypothetical protein
MARAVPVNSFYVIGTIYVTEYNGEKALGTKK